MRVLQLIDSLEAGGAERMAVSIANSLVGEIEASHICVTRKEGSLKKSIVPDVSYLFLGKKSSLDLFSLLRLRKYVARNRITLIHAHSTSFFFGVLLKLTNPKLKLIWHAHHGEKVNASRKNYKALYASSYLIDKIITVNKPLMEWCKNTLAVKEVYFLPNFVPMTSLDLDFKPASKVVVHLANLKTPKNHIMALKAFAIVAAKHPDWQLHLLGKDFNDDYSNELKAFVKANGLENSIIFLGAVDNIPAALSQASIGLLSSKSEGWPMALMEYGAMGLSVITTNAGASAEIVGHCAKVVSNDANLFANAINDYIENPEERYRDSKSLQLRIIENFSSKSVIPLYLKLYKN